MPANTTSSTPAPPRKPESDRSDGTREKILREATTAFSERGFDGATFREIGVAAGVNFQSIRYHFGSKEQLWEAVVEQLSTHVEQAIVYYEEALVSLAPRDRLKAMVHAIVTYQAEHPELQRILLREAMKGSERYRKAFDQHFKRFEGRVDSFLGGMQAQGIIKAGVPLDDLFFAARGALNYRLVAPVAGDAEPDTRTIKPEIIDRHAEAVTRLLLAD